MRDYKKSGEEGCPATKKTGQEEIKSKIMGRIDHILANHSVK